MLGELAGRAAYTLIVAVGLLVGSGAAYGAGGSSQLSQKPIPLQTEAHSLFAVEDIRNYEGLVGELKANSDRPDTPGGRVWQLLPPLLRQELDAVPDGAEIEEKLRYRFINGMNGVIRRRDMYTREAFGGVQIDADLMTRLSDLEGLGPVDATRANRDLLMAAFPQYILESQVKPFPRRPRTLRIFGDDFLNTGNIQEGIELPTGAVWQPSLLAFGTFRSAWQYMDTGNRFPPNTNVSGPPIPGRKIKIEEWVNRLDLFFNLYLTPTERIVLGLRPIDENGTFSGYIWQPGVGEVDRWEGGLDADIEVLFFEGDFGELFPNLDPHDSRRLDIGMAIGRQPLFFQEGILINDVVDGIGLTRNNILLPGIPKLRITAFWGWQHINRGVGAGVNRRFDGDADLYALFTSFETGKRTVDFDVAYIDGKVRRTLRDDGSIDIRGGDQLNVGLSSVQRIGYINTAFRINQSWAMGVRDNVDAADGTLIFLEASWTPPRTHDLVYATAWWANDHYRSIARDPAVGGPLGRAGILYESPGIGAFPSPIDNTANEAIGGALGYQRFFDNTRKQIILEIAGRGDTDGRDMEEYGIGARYQQAWKNRFVWRLDAFYVERTGRDDRKGVRAEFLMEF